MAQYINTNISSLVAQRNLSQSQNALQTSMARLSSGMRINSAADDAAGFAIATRLSSQINGTGQATLNANDAISLVQTADSGMASIANNLQTMRTLAVQASNSTYTASDRASMNDEVQQLKQEIDRVAGGTNFNGLKLLDGSFTSQSFQVGANNTANDSIQVNSISSMTTSALGGVGTSAQTTVTGVKPTAALSAGDLTLNGVQVGASQLGSGAGQSTSSAFSIAAAINLANTGVTATANSNTVTSSAATNFTSIAADTFSINGINVGAVAAGGNAEGQGANLAAAINKVATQTGVTANADAKTGVVTLTAADGRDVNIGLNGVSAASSSAALVKANFLAQTGLASGVVGTQSDSGGTAGSIALTGSTVTLAAATAKGAIAGDTFSVNGISVGAVAAGTDTDDQITKLAAAITSSQQAGGGTITATVDSSGGAGTYALVLTDSNTSNTTVAISMNGLAADSTTATANQTTLKSLTGMTSGQAGKQGTSASQTAAVNAANQGSITLNSTSSDGIVIGGANAANAGVLAHLGQNGPTTTSSISAIAAVDVSTQNGAQSALTAIDGAISMVTKNQGMIGALQNRFTSAVTNLQSTSTNLSAARSRIQDTDFASETANMTRAQVLQQAGTAILAQANSAPNGVMSLLR